MAIAKLVSTHLRRNHFSLHRPFISLLTTPVNPSPSPTTSNFNHHPQFSPFNTSSFRDFSSDSFKSGFTHDLNTVTESELQSLGFTDGAHIVNGVLNDSILPIRYIIGFLDGYHDLTNFPWWIIIGSSTLALRIVLLPWLILQLQKLKRIAEVFPKLPPPFPPLFSGRSYVDQFSKFRRERKALGCPSFLWFLASYTVQLPCFILLMASIRSMSLNHHPGFDNGGILWFENLTELPNGVLGPILPLCIAGLHFCNIQVSFRFTSVGSGTGLLDLLANYYKKYLEFLTLPLLFMGFCIPQGSLVYWVTNISVTLIQQLSLQHPTICQKLGLPDRKALQAAAIQKRDREGSELPDAPGKKRMISGFSLSSRELVDYSISYLAKGNKDKAMSLLRLAIDKDPGSIRAWTVMGQIKVQEELFEEATECLDNVISEISLLEQPIDGETVDLLIQASILNGAAYYRQGKLAEALVHFERVRDMQEPEDKAAKDRYYEGFVLLASFLLNEGRKDEAAKYLRKAAAYDPQYTSLLKSVEKDKDDFVDDLVSSRRRDY